VRSAHEIARLAAGATSLEEAGEIERPVAPTSRDIEIIVLNGVWRARRERNIRTGETVTVLAAKVKVQGDWRVVSLGS
jgi:hypothetical protein